MGMNDLPCATLDQCVDLAVKLGTEPDYRNEISRRIAERRDEIFEERGVVEEHERFFETACEGGHGDE